jgi:diguanylate cyclase (GGDEF)-like protein/PAS domain S-box-containing protein
MLPMSESVAVMQDDARDDAVAEAGSAYALRTVRVGLQLTVLTLVAMVGFVALPGHGAVDPAGFVALFATAAAGAVVIVLLPWKRMFETEVGRWALFAWCLSDILIISGAIAVTGGARSDLWALYGLTTIFFTASYLPRGRGALLAMTGAAYVLTLAITGWHIPTGTLFVRLAIGVLVFLITRFLTHELRAATELRTGATLRAEVAEAEAARTQWFSTLLRDSSDIVTSFDEGGTIIFISPSVRAFGYEPDELIGTPVWDLVHPEDLERATAQITEQFAENRAPRPVEYRAKTKSGSWRHIEGIATNLLDEPGVNAVVVDARDVTERKIAEMLAASQSHVLEQIAAGQVLADVLRQIAALIEEQVDAQCTIAVTGAGGARLIVSAFGPHDRDAAAEPASWSRDVTSSDGLSRFGEVRLRFSSSRFVTEREQHVADVAASLVTIAVERDFAKARLAHQAQHDTLTGLANRQVFLETLESALTSARDRETIAVLFVDLDGFKEVNDGLGHHVGDQVLVALGHRLAGALRKHDVIARFGGDEFVALCRVDGAEHARHLAERVLARVREPISIAAHRIRLDASIGITLAAVMADDGPHWAHNSAWVQAAADELLKEADAAMYRAKQAGGGCAVVHGSEASPPPPHLRAAGDDE